MNKGKEIIDSYSVDIQFQAMVMQNVTIKVFTEGSWRNFSSYWLPVLSGEHLCVATSPAPYIQLADEVCAENVDERLFTAVPCSGKDVKTKLVRKDIVSLIQDILYISNLKSINVIVPIRDFQWTASEMQKRADLAEVSQFLEETYLHEITSQAKTA